MTRVEFSEVTYDHLLFDQHEIVIAQGAPSKRFYPVEAGFSAMGQAAKPEFTRLVHVPEPHYEAGYGHPY